MGEEKKNNQEFQGMEYAIIGLGVLTLAAFILFKFMIPIIFGLILGIVWRLSLSHASPLYKIKGLALVLLNASVLTYLAVGLPYSTHAKNQYTGVFGEAGTGFITEATSAWNYYWSNSTLFNKIATVHHIAWQDVSAHIWGALAVGVVLFFVGDLIAYLTNDKKENPFNKRLVSKAKTPERAETLFKVMSFPVLPILNLISFKQATTGHHYAVSLRDGNFWFTRKMLYESVLLFLLVIPVFFTSESSSDITFFTAGVLCVPFYSFWGAFLIGLVPNYGDFLNALIFNSAHGHLDLDRLNPVQRRSANVEGFHLGRIHDGRDYVLTEKNLNHHIQIVAPSGGGKTNIIKNFLLDRIEKGHGVIFLDYKADFEVAEYIYKTAIHFGRKDEVRIFSLSNREISVPYNPLSHGTAAELQSRLINAFTWSEVYYKAKAESTLLKVFRGLTELRDLKGKLITLKTVHEVLNKRGHARVLAAELKNAGGSQWMALEEVAETLDRTSEAKELQGLITNLEKVIYSGAGELLTDDASEKAFTIEEAIDQGLITYFLMNSLSSKETATSVGKLLLQDLMGFVGRAYDKGVAGRKPITIVIDEFAEFAIPDFPSFLNRVRGAGIGVMIAHQTRGDLKAVSDDYQNKIEANTNTKIVAGVIDPEDAQFYAQLIGTQTVTKDTSQVVEENFMLMKSRYTTGMKSSREVEEFIIHPNRIKRIEQGEALVISRTVDTGFGLVGVDKAHDFNEMQITREQIEREMKATRVRYMASVIPGLRGSVPKGFSRGFEKESARMWE